MPGLVGETGGDVDRQPRALGQSVGRCQRGVSERRIELDSDAGSARRGEPVLWRLAVGEAGEGLVADHLGGGQVDDRLEDGEERVLLEGSGVRRRRS